MADMNEDVREDPVLTTATNMGLQDAVTTQHGKDAPNTHNRGSAPIDGIFLPLQLIHTIRSGYLAFGKGIPSDHCLIWVDIPAAAFRWLTPPEMVPLKAQRLKCKDPRIVAQYNQELEKALTTSKLSERLQALEQAVTGCRLTQKQQQHLEAIDEEMTKAKLTAEQLCRKLTAGKVQWCPQLSKAIAQILYWKGVRKRIRGGHIGAKYLTRLAKKGGLSHTSMQVNLSEEQASAQVRKGYKQYNRLKQDKNHRDRWIADPSRGNADIKENNLEKDSGDRKNQGQCKTNGTSNRNKWPVQRFKHSLGTRTPQSYRMPIFKNQGQIGNNVFGGSRTTIYTGTAHTFPELSTSGNIHRIQCIHNSIRTSPPRNIRVPNRYRHYDTKTYSCTCPTTRDQHNTKKWN